MIMYDNTIYVDARVYECAILDEDMRIGEAFCMYGAMQKWIFFVKNARGKNARNNQVRLPLDGNRIATIK